MARIEFLNTAATRALGVSGRVLPAPLIPSMAAMAKTARYFDAPVDEMQPAERVVAILWDVLTRAGAQPTIHQAAMLVDATALSLDQRHLGGDFVVQVEPGDPVPDISDEPEAEGLNESGSAPFGRAGDVRADASELPKPPSIES